MTKRKLPKKKSGPKPATKKQKGRKPQRRKKGLAGITAGKSVSYGQAAKDMGLNVVALLGGGVLGAIFGKISLVAGIPVAFIGYKKGNPLITSAGMGMILSNGFQKGTGEAVTNGIDGLEGLDIKQMTAEAKERIKTFLGNFSQKLFIKPKNGLNGSDDEVRYYLNPYNGAVSGPIDLTDLDNIQWQVAEMSNNGVSGYLPGGYTSDDDYNPEREM